MEFEVHKEEEIYDKDWLRDELFKIRYWNIEEVPNYVVHSDSPETRFKARTAWFVNLASTLEIALDENLIEDTGMKNCITEFIDWYANRTDWVVPGHNLAEDEILYTSQYIERGNILIDKVLETLPVKPLELGSLGESLPEVGFA